MKSHTLFTIFCLLFLCCNKIKADPFLIKTNEAFYEIRSSMKILQDENFTIDDIQTDLVQKQFQDYPTHTLDIRAGQYYWGRMELLNQLSDSNKHLEWVLLFSNSFTRTDIFIQRDDGSFEHQMNGSFRPNAKKTFTPTSAGNLLKLHLLPGQNQTIYFRGISDRPTITPTFYLKLVDADQFYLDLFRERAGNSLFIGFILMMLVYNVFLFFFWRDQSFLFYSGYLFTIVFYSLFISEELANWIEPVLFPEHPQYLYFCKLIIYLGVMSYLAFIQQFLGTKELLPKWHRYFNRLTIVGLVWMLVDASMLVVSNFSFVATDGITVAFVLLFIVISFCFLIPLYKTKDRKAYFIIAGVIVMNMGLLATSISRAFTPSFSVFYLKIGTIFEVIVFSLGLAYRQKENEKAKQASKFELEKSKLLQAQEASEKNRLQELNRFKNNLYTNITHEFRTPLTVIQGMAEQINGKYKKETELIQRNSRQLLHLVNQMLDLAKLESGRLRLKAEQGNIIAFLKYEIESYIALTTSNNIELHFKTSTDVINMDFDIQKMRHIFANLLSNAIKFIPDKGQIHIVIHKIHQASSPQLFIRIKDTGIGIDANQLPYIFDRFYQVDTSTTRLVEGTGIGLALTKELVELMEGSIRVKSVVNEGTSFEIRLPITQNAPLVVFEEELKFAEQTILDKALSEVSTFSILENMDNPLVLIIEDNTDVIQYLIACLQEDYRILTALNGREGIQTAIEKIPDIIISDVMMPYADGYEVVEQLKEDVRTNHIPIILLTARADYKSKLKGLKKGTDAYLPKPFDQEELSIRLNKLISLRRTLQSRYTAADFRIQAEAQMSKEEIFLHQLRKTIETNMDDSNFAVEMLAKEMAMSRQQLYRKTKAITGKSIAVYVRLIRLHHAKKLLQTTGLSVSEAAYQVGFSDPSYFSKTFSEEFGYAPSIE